MLLLLLLLSIAIAITYSHGNEMGAVYKQCEQSRVRHWGEIVFEVNSDFDITLAHVHNI